MNISVLTPETPKHEVINYYKDILVSHHIEIDHIEDDRPWGGEIWIKNSASQPFQDIYFAETQYSNEDLQGPPTPKFLIVQPGHKLSWQYHKRRQEIWRVVHGPIGAILNNSDFMTAINIFTTGSLIEVGKEMRHRLVGLDNWGVVAEIWKHNDPMNVSTEEDIIRIQDDYKRK